MNALPDVNTHPGLLRGRLHRLRAIPDGASRVCVLLLLVLGLPMARPAPVAAGVRQGPTVGRQTEARGQHPEAMRQQTWWWQRSGVQQALGLSRDQIDALDHIYRESLPERRRLRTQLQALQRRFRDAMLTGRGHAGATSELVERLTEAQRRSNVARTMLLVHMLNVLAPPQRRRLAEIVSADGL